MPRQKTNPDSCLVEGCSNPGKRVRASLCPKHYSQSRRGRWPDERTISGVYGEGATDRFGYRHVSNRAHPNARKNGRIYEHVVVMTEMLGRPLARGKTFTTKTVFEMTTVPRTLNCG